MNNLKKIGLGILLISLGNFAFAQPNFIKNKLKTSAPEDGEAIVKLYSDKERTNEITTITDGTTDLYFRAYIWKAKTKRGDSPYEPMKSEYCFSFQEGEFPIESKTRGFDYAKVKSEVDAKSMKAYVGETDYIDIDVNLKETQFLDYFVRDAEAGKKYKFTARLSGQCKFTLANTVFEIDLTNGMSKYESLLLEANSDIEIPEDLYPSDTDLHQRTKALITSTYGYSTFEGLYFYTAWEPSSNGTERYAYAAFTTKSDGKCYLHNLRVWEEKTLNGTWTLPNAVNEIVTKQIDCAKLK